MTFVPRLPRRPLAIAVTLLLCVRPLAADEPPTWLPFTAIGGNLRAEIETVARDTPLGPHLHDPTQLQLAFAELDEHPAHEPADEPAGDREEILLRLAPDACAQPDCPTTILTRHHGSLVELTSLRGTELSLGTGFSHGIRYLVLDGGRLWFTGREFLLTKPPAGWSILTDIDPVNRAWIEEKGGIGIELVPERNPPDANRVVVAFVDLDETASSAAARPEVLVIDRNFQSCGSGGCAIAVYSTDGDHAVDIGGMLGSSLKVGPGYRNGKRDLILNGVALFTFDGEVYQWTARLQEPARSP